MSNFFRWVFDRQGMRSYYPHRDRAFRDYLEDVRDRAIVLTPAEEIPLLERAKRGDKEAVERLVDANLRLVIVIASRFQGKGLQMLDLIAEGNTGLLEAIKRFDIQKRNRFATYAKFWVLQKIARAIAYQGKTIRTPESAETKMQNIQKQVEEALQLGFEPTVEYLARQTGIPDEEVVEWLTLMQEPMSLSQSNSAYDPLSEVIHAPALILSSESSPPPAIFADVVHLMDRVLSDPERQVIGWLYGLTDGICYSHEEVTEKMLLSGQVKKRVFRNPEARAQRVRNPHPKPSEQSRKHIERVRQLEREALKKIRLATEKGEEV